MSRRRRGQNLPEDDPDTASTFSSSDSSSEMTEDDVENAAQRDLSLQEMEKLVQLQDLTGIDDLQICRALLESKNWDLEATAREHLNLPTLERRPEPEPVPPPEAPEARHVIRPQNGGRRGAFPIQHNNNTLYSWGIYLITLPFKLTFGTISSVFDIFLRIFGLRAGGNRRVTSVPRRNVSAEQEVDEFAREFEAKYGRDHVPFHRSSYNKALEEAKKDLRFLLVYLHCPSHQDTQRFCEETLASQTMKDFVNNLNVILWACSTDTAEGYRVSQALRESSYPFLALIVLRENRMMVVGRVEGFMEAGPLCNRLEAVIRDNEAYIVAARAERTERHINAEIRQEQDAAFQETLRQDQERERLKKEAEEAKRREEEEERQAVLAEQARKERIAQLKIDLVSKIPDEPDPANPEAVRVLIKLPEGQRLERRFLKSQSLKCLYYYVFCHPESPDEFDITTNFPRKVLDCKPSEDGGPDPPTFEAAGLGQSVMLFVNDLEA